MSLVDWKKILTLVVSGTSAAPCLDQTPASQIRRTSLACSPLVVILMTTGMGLSTPLVEAAPAAPHPAPVLSDKKTQERLESVSEQRRIEKKLEKESILDTGNSSEWWEVTPEAKNIDEGRFHVESLRPSRVVRSHSRSLLLGTVVGAVDAKDSTALPWVSLVVQNDNSNETAQSYGLSISNQAVWGLHWDSHQYCCLGQKAEPFWGIGLGAFYLPQEMLASFINIDRYHLRLRGGFEDLFNLGRRFRTELVLRVGTMGVSGQVSLGWTWSEDEFFF